MKNEAYIVYENDELYHHGILGQKWGKLNGPPYPLGSSSENKRSAFETKLAAMKKSAAKRAVERERLKEAQKRADYSVKMAKINADKKARIEMVEKTAPERVANETTNRKPKTESKENQKNTNTNNAPDVIKEPESTKNRQTAKQKYKNINATELDDRSLQAAINRMNMENLYAQLTAEKPNPAIAYAKTIGKNMVTRVINNVANRAADELSNRINGALFSSSNNNSNNISQNNASVKKKIKAVAEPVVKTEAKNESSVSKETENKKSFGVEDLNFSNQFGKNKSNKYTKIDYNKNGSDPHEYVDWFKKNYSENKSVFNVSSGKESNRGSFDITEGLGKSSKIITKSFESSIKTLRNEGLTLSEIADKLDISESTASKYSDGYDFSKELLSRNQEKIDKAREIQNR